MEAQLLLNTAEGALAHHRDRSNHLSSNITPSSQAACQGLESARVSLRRQSFMGPLPPCVYKGTQLSGSILKTP